MKKFLTLPYIIFAELFFIYGMIFAIPILIIPGIFIVIPSIVIASRKFGLIPPAIQYAVFLTLSCIFNYNILIILGTVVIIAASLTFFFAFKKTKNYIIIACSGVAAVLLSVVSAIAGFCAVFNLTPQEALKVYIENSADDVLIVEIAKYTILANIDSNTQREVSVMPPDPEINLDKIVASQTPNKHTSDAVNYLAYIVFLDIADTLPEYILKYIVMLALLSFLLIYASTPFKCTFEEQENLITEYLKKQKTEYNLNGEFVSKYGRLPLSRLEIPRIYFALTFFPIMTFLLFSTNTAAGQFVGTMLTPLCIVPFAFAGYLLTLFFADCFTDSVPKLIAKIVLTIFFAICFFNDFILIVYSIIGVADAIVHTRRVMDKLLYL